LTAPSKNSPRGEKTGAKYGFKPSNKLNIADPLKIDATRAKSIKSVSLINTYDFYKAEQKIHPDTIRLHNTLVEELRSNLNKSGRFEVISALKFKKKSQELNLLGGNIFVMNDDDLAEETAKVGKALNCDGVLILGQKQQKINMGAAIAAVAFVGTMDVNITLNLKLVDSGKGKTLWYQESDYILNMGEIAFANVPDADLRKKISPVVKPLTDDLLNSFVLNKRGESVARNTIKDSEQMQNSSVSGNEKNTDQPNNKYYVVTKKVRLRAAANTKSKTIATLNKGDKVEFLGNDGKWYNIKSVSGTAGWVIKDYLQ